MILLIREPPRLAADGTAASAPSPTDEPPTMHRRRSRAWLKVIPIYIVLAAASFSDNAVGAWSPTLLIREFGRNPAQVRIELGLLLTLGFGGGVLIGGVLADRAAARGGWSRKLHARRVIPSYSVCNYRLLYEVSLRNGMSANIGYADNSACSMERRSSKP